MADLEYSNDALEAKALFYNKEITVYVEGKDDILFWNSIFKLVSMEAYVEEVGGRIELEKYFQKVKNENANFLIATDNDNSEFCRTTFSHSNIIKTYGYSIENSMYYNPEPFAKLISNFCRKKVEISEEFKSWQERFSLGVYDLIVFDIANMRFQKGKSIFGDSCHRFLKNNKSPEVCTEKINSFLSEIKEEFSPKEVSEVKELIRKNKKNYWFLIKGHFIKNALINFLKNLINKHSGSSKILTEDYIYSITVETVVSQKKREDIQYIIDQLKDIQMSA